MVGGQSGEFEPVYLTLADVLELHALIIGATAIEAADQLRNRAGNRAARNARVRSEHRSVSEIARTALREYVDRAA